MVNGYLVLCFHFTVSNNIHSLVVHRPIHLQVKRPEYETSDIQCHTEQLNWIRVYSSENQQEKVLLTGRVIKCILTTKISTRSEKILVYTVYQ